MAYPGIGALDAVTTVPCERSHRSAVVWADAEPMQAAASRAIACEDFMEFLWFGVAGAEWNNLGGRSTKITGSCKAFVNLFALIVLGLNFDAHEFAEIDAVTKLRRLVGVMRDKGIDKRNAGMIIAG